MREIWRVGGAQAIAALAYGTGHIAAVEKIVGPGNRYVAAAKRLVEADVAIDMAAGPTEVLVLATRGNARYIAADLVAQAEHDPEAVALLVTTSFPLARRVADEVHRQLKALPRANPAHRALAERGAILVASSMEKAVRFARRFAPEHLSLPGGRALLERLDTAGSVFVGPYSAQSAGDFATGSNHSLPTGGAARFRGGLSAADFVRCVSVQEVSRAGLRRLAPVVRAFAAAEGLAGAPACGGGAAVRRAAAPTVRRAVRHMRSYHPPLEGRGRRGALRLDFNENTAGPAAGVLRALAALDARDVATYPEYGAARAAIARAFGRSPRELILTNGTDDAIHLVVDAFADPGDQVLILEPSYAMYRFYAERAGARVTSVRFGPPFRFPLERTLAALRRRPRLALLASPNNPTGTVIPAEALRRVLDAAPSTVVVVDEAYFEFCGATALGWIRRRPNLVIARTFSKARGLAGLRLGCLLANARLVAALSRAHSPYSVNAAALAAGVAALRAEPATRRFAAEVVRARGRLEAALDRLGIRRFPSGGNFVLVDVGRRAGRLVAELARRGILVRDRRRDFGRPGYVRITVGTEAQTRRLIRALEALWPRG